MKPLTVIGLSLLFLAIESPAQIVDSLDERPLKIHHAEPLYMDLVRDIGARKGEREWNLGWGLEKNSRYSANSGFIEYEFAPLNRLGFEVEVPFTLYRSYLEEGQRETSAVPHNRIEGVKLATQYTFLVSGKHQLSMAAGYMHELVTHSFYTISQRHSLWKGHRMTPFLIIARKWGANIHSMLYTGPEFDLVNHGGPAEMYYQANLSMHYVLPHSGHFIGLEMNQETAKHFYSLVFRPQVKIKLADGLALGLVTGLPLHMNSGNSISFLTRLIYEPRHRTH